MSRSSSRPLRSTGPAFLLSGASQEREVRSGDPTLFNGYGGFLALLLPSCAGAMERLLPDQGSAYVVANLRGGGEFGPGWHEAAQAATKQRTWDDFIAFAEDLIRRKVTSPRRLGVVGGSQGDLLLGTATTQRRDRFNAAIVQVALLTCFGSPSWVQAPPTSANMAIPPSRAARVDRGLLTLSEACPGQDLPSPLHSHFHQGRPRASGPRPQGSRQACCARPALLLL